MNRTNILIIVVILLGGITGFVLVTQDDGSRISDRSNDRQFAYADFEDVDRIFIADRLNHQVTLTRGGITGWLADGKPANENVLKNLTAALKTIDIRTLPTRKAVPNMIKALAAEGIRVQLFDKKGNELRDYYIGGATHDELGTFAIMDGSENPYVVHMPHFTGNVRTRFNHWGDEWRDRVYFRVDPNKVEEFSIDYPKQQSESFRLTRAGGKYTVEPLYGGRPTLDVPRGVAERALSRYEKYYVNRYENTDETSITAAKELLPFAIITVKQEGQEPQVMKVYPRYQDRTFANDAKTGEEIVGGGLDAFNAFINDDEDWVLLNVETTQPLLVSYEAFR